MDRVEAGFVTRPTEVGRGAFRRFIFPRTCVVLQVLGPSPALLSTVWREDGAAVKPSGSLFDSGREAVERHVDLKRWSMNERIADQIPSE